MKRIEILGIIVILFCLPVAGCKKDATDENTDTPAPNDNITINQTPVTASQSLRTVEGETVQITLNGWDPDDDELTIELLSEPENGSLSESGFDFLYTPDNGFSGADSFTFRVFDGQAYSLAATVTISVESEIRDVVKVFLMAGQSNMEGNNTSIAHLEKLICHANSDYVYSTALCGSTDIETADISRLFVEADDPVNDYQAALADFSGSAVTQKLGQFLCSAGAISASGQNCGSLSFDLTDRFFATISDYYYNISKNSYAYGNDAFKQMSEAIGVAEVNSDGFLNADLLMERSDATVLQFTGRLSGGTLSLSQRYGLLGPKYGKNTQNYGPELIFGHYMADLLAEDVLLLKLVQGGTDLRVDWKTPSSTANTGNNFTADELAQDSLYDALLEKAVEIQDADNLAAYFPQYSGKSVEIAGFIWFQGWNDGGNTVNLQNYEINLTCLINDLRNDLNLPQLPVVITQSHRGEPDGMLQIAQANVAAAMDNSELAVTDDLSGYYHFDTAAHLVIGKRMAEHMTILLTP